MNPHLTDMLAIFSLLAASGTAKATMAAVVLRDTDPCSRTVATQRLRYGLLTLGTLIAVGCTIYLHTTASMAELHAAANEYMAIDNLSAQMIGVIAYGLTYGVWALTGLAVALYVYYKPAVMAFKLLMGRYKGGYITTSAKRAGRGHWEPVAPYVVRDEQGRPMRRFRSMV